MYNILKPGTRSGIYHLCSCPVCEKSYDLIYLQGGLVNVILSEVAVCPDINLLYSRGREWILGDNVNIKGYDALRSR